MNIFKRFNEVGVTVLIASHDVHLIERYAVRRVMLAHGRVLDGLDLHVEPAGSITTGAPEVAVAPLVPGASSGPLVLPDIRTD
jgi:cell division transport system ATP-binding protein